ncbi:hypothetical protein [Roseateles violae]|uniref:Uncharacterized protein n=1 Tax=Roseateles violae TaxID=3058042 RepID=A0ABT8DTL6_9BURK|nr:hypothetical protein [Pelomonas sp. PFR6]MDN3921458.1 hypothetical protein [Pelomonas sp. PFR6]
MPIQSHGQGAGLPYVGSVKPRSTAEMRSAGITSPFGIGGETTDRGYSTFSMWKDHLGPLGAQKIRVQSGWHFIEKTITTPASYDFGTLDAIVDGVRAQGVQPLVFLGYGNEQAGCVDCGTKGLGGAVPTGAGRQRFIEFVKATVKRYNEPTVRVSDWQLWNEPDGHVAAADYGPLIVEMAKAIKSVQPGAKITIGSFTTGVLGGTASSGYAYAQQVLDYFAANKGPTVPNADVSVGYHPYWSPPDYDSYASELAKFDAFRTLVEGKGFRIRMDESGAPSGPCQYYAFCALDSGWNEESQAKWMLRRMLGDFARGIESSIFTITDLHYDSGKNPKGLLETGTWVWDPNNPGVKNGDQSVKRRKQAYGSYQNATAIFDSRLVRITDHGCTAPWGYTVHAYKRDDAGVERRFLAVWNRTLALPTSSTAVSNIDISCSNFHFTRYAQVNTLLPRFVNLLDGKVYATSTAMVTSNNAATHSLSLKAVPASDAVVLIADQGIAALNP